MFCPTCGTWNRTRAVNCLRCKGELPELKDSPREPPDPEISLVRKATGGRYRIMRRLGSGGMAHVYHALHSVLERPLVVKVLHQHLARDPEMRERFRREAEAASQLVHPHVCAIVDYGALGDTVYLVMPFLAGGSLADILVRDRTVPSPEDETISRELASRIETALAPLTEREQEVVRLRFGFANDREHTLAEVGRKLGLSRERVRQIEARAVAKLRKSQAA